MRSQCEAQTDEVKFDMLLNFCMLKKILCTFCIICTFNKNLHETLETVETLDIF